MGKKFWIIFYNSATEEHIKVTEALNIQFIVSNTKYIMAWHIRQDVSRTSFSKP